ncbi:MAG: DnaJ domain-containing protein [Myxococcota bacterium]
MFDDTIAPKPRPDVDFGSLSAQPTPEQYFLLSRINGELTIAELCRISGQPRQQTLQALAQLVEYGLIEIPGDDGEEDASASSSAEVAETTSEASASSDSTSESESSDSSGSKGEAKSSGAKGEAKPSGAKGEAKPPGKAEKKQKRREVTPNFPVPPSELEFDPELMSLDIPLDDEQRRQALCLYEQLDQMNFYDLFGVEPDASRRDIKKAYFRLSKRYHPDKFFRKELHDFGPMLERVFQEITKAYRILSNRDKRQEYDETLARSEASSPPEASPAGASSLAENTSRAFQDEENEQKKHKRNKKDAAALLLVRRAEKLVEREEYGRAAGEYRKALALKREPEMAIEVARMLVTEGGHLEEAISFARAALKLDPRHIEARVLLSELYVKVGRAEDAVRHLEKAARLAPANQEIEDKLEALKSEQG